jgi:hypothetical protein
LKNKNCRGWNAVSHDVGVEKYIDYCRCGWSGLGRFPTRGVESYTYACSCVKHSVASRKTGVEKTKKQSVIVMVNRKVFHK